MSGRRPNTTLVWNFFNSFREAQCPDSVEKVFSGPVLRSWNGTVQLFIALAWVAR